MEKTKLGISVGLMGAIAYFVCFFSGYIGALIVVGYILLMEKNSWLRKTAVKALILTIAFSLVPALINLIPDAMGLIGSIFSLFGGSFGVSFIDSIISIITMALNMVEAVLFIALGLSALSQGSVAIPVIDDLTEKNMEEADKAEPAAADAE